MLTGGFSEQELREAGAVAVFESIDELRRGLTTHRSGRPGDEHHRQDQGRFKKAAADLTDDA